jgi:hypothetical protein
MEIIVPKNSCGMVGSKEYLLYQKLATGSIEHKFGVPLHLVTDKSVAKDGDQTVSLHLITDKSVDKDGDQIRHLLKVHHSLHAFEHEIESVPCKFELPSELNAMHLAAFCREINPLACLPVINAMANKFDQHDAAQHAVNYMNTFLLQHNISFGRSKKDKSIEQELKMDFKHTPLIWDTGATHGLTPSLKDFIHYYLCVIPVRYISKVDRVIGIVTVMHKFRAKIGEDIFLPGLSFHLPTADIRLMSPQSYHQQVTV